MNTERDVKGMFSKRGRFEIIYSILVAIRRDNPGALKTHILYRSNLSHQLLNKYLELLVKNKLVKTRKIGKKLVYEITDKGRAFIRTYHNLRTILNIERARGQ